MRKAILRFNIELLSLMLLGTVGTIMLFDGIICWLERNVPGRKKP